MPFLDARAHSYEYPSWSLDGRFLAVRHFEATWGLWTVDVRTGETTPLTYGLSLHFPAWSPEGGRLVYTYASDLHMIDPHTGEHIRQITHDVDDVFERWPVWVDAWHIAFLPFDYADGDADRDIRVIDLTGKERERLTLVDRGVHVEAFSWVDPSRDVSAKGMDASVWADLKHGAVEANVTAGRVR